MGNCRVVAAVRDLGGDLRRQQILGYLEAHADVERVRVPVTRWTRWNCVLRNVTFDRREWRERSKKNAYFFRRTWRAFSARVGSRGDGGNSVVLLFEALYGPEPTESLRCPYVIYEDATLRQVLKVWPADVPDTARTGEYQGLVSACYRRAGGIVTSNEAARQSLIEDYGVGRDRVVNVGQGCDLALESPCSGAERSKTILFVGYDFDRKGGPTLLKAFREVRRRIPEARLMIVGPELSVGDPGVEVRGRVSDRRQLRQLYSDSAVFALPAIFDPMPHAALEAMALGIPTVVSSGCGTHEILEDGTTGFVVPPGNVNVLAERLTSILTDQEMAASMGSRAADIVRARFNWKRVASRVSDVLQRCLSSHQGAALSSHAP